MSEIKSRQIFSRFVFFLLLIAVFSRAVISGRIFPLSNYVFLIIFGIFFLMNLPGRGQGFWFTKQQETLLLLFFGAIGLSVPLGMNSSDSMREMLLFFQYLLIVMALLRWARPEYIPTALAALILAGLAHTAVALRQYFGGFESTLAQVEITDPYFISTLTEKRVFGLTFSPDMLAGLLCMLIPISIGLAHGSLKTSGRVRSYKSVLVFVPALLLVAALVLTRSLGGWLAATAGIIVLIYLWPGRAKISPGLKTGLAVIAAAAIISALAWFGLTRGHQFADFDSWNNPIALRFINWKVSMKAYADKPVFGVGIGNLGLAYPLHRPLKANEVQYSHNNYIQVLVEAGPLALAGLLGIAGLFWALAWRQQRKDSTGGEAFIIRGLLAGGVAFLAHSFIDFDLYTPEVASVFWAAFALLIVNSRAADMPQKGAGRWSRRLLAVVVALLMAGSIYLFYCDRDLKKAEALMNKGENRRAVQILKDHIKWEGHNHAARVMLARALKAAEAPAGEIIEQYRMAQALNPCYSFYHQELGDFLVEYGWIEAAIKEYERAVELYPNNYYFNLSLGIILQKQGRLEEAEAVFRHAVKCIWKNYEARLSLALVFIEQGRLAEAKDALEGLTADYPDRKPGWTALWRVYIETGDEELAEKVMKEIQKRWPESPVPGSAY